MPKPPPDALTDVEAMRAWEREVLAPWKAKLEQRAASRRANGRTTGRDRARDERAEIYDTAMTLAAADRRSRPVTADEPGVTTEVLEVDGEAIEVLWVDQVTTVDLETGTVEHAGR